MHRAQLHETIAGLKVRLEGQAKLDDDSAIGGALMRSRWQGQGGLTTCSPLSGDPVCAIAEAARRALARPCWGASEQEAHEERATAARVRSVLARTEVVECAHTQALVLADPESGLGDDGTMGQCFFCKNYGNCATEVVVCDTCVCVFHEACLAPRGVSVPEGEDEALTPESCPVCVERVRLERLDPDPAVPSVLSLTVRGSRLTAVLDEAVLDEPAPARSKRATTQRSPQSPGTGRRVCSRRAAPTASTTASARAGGHVEFVMPPHLSVMSPPVEREEPSPAAAVVVAARAVPAAEGQAAAADAAAEAESEAEESAAAAAGGVPKTREELKAAIAHHEFGLFKPADSMLATPAIKALKAMCAAKGVNVPAAAAAHKRGQPLPDGFVIMKVHSNPLFHLPIARQLCGQMTAQLLPETVRLSGASPKG